MSLPSSWAKAATPEALFLQLWAEAATCLDAIQRYEAREPPPAAMSEMVEVLLSLDSAEGAASELVRLANAIWLTSDACEHSEHGLLLGAMRALDIAFLHVHPRTVLLSPSVAPGFRVPRWLEDARDRRTLTGEYGRDDERRLIPRGPLSRPARTHVDVNADTLASRFSGLTAAPLRTALEQHSLDIRSIVIGHSAARGVPTGNTGREVVGFAPVAESDADFVFRTWRDDGGKPFLDVETSPRFDAADRLLSAVKKLGAIDVLIAPELTISQSSAEKFGAGLQPNTAPRLTVAGSGPSGDPNSAGRRFNRSVVFNASGAILWSHDKVWPYGMGPQQTEKCKLGDLGDEELLMECVRPGNTLTVADLDGFGRVAILVCQDFQIERGVPDILDFYQPDWVFVPILDKGVGVGRWMHTRAFDLSGRSRARFVVVCSLALAERCEDKAYPNSNVALLVGPSAISALEEKAGDLPRVFATASCDYTKPRCGQIKWDHSNSVWKHTNLSAGEPDRKPSEAVAEVAKPKRPTSTKATTKRSVKATSN